MNESASHNIEQVCAWLEEFLLSFNFSLPGKDRNLGRDLAHVFAASISERSASESRGADGSEKWPANKRRYAKMKADHYGWPEEKPNYRTGQMLSHASLFGRTKVKDQLVELIYGRQEPPEECYSPFDLRTEAMKKADESITDVEKAEYASTERPFFEVDDDVEADVIEAADEALDEYILLQG